MNVPSLLCRCSISLLVVSIIAGCGAKQAEREYPKVDHSAEAASAVKVQVQVLYTLSRQKPSSAKSLVNALLQSLEGIDQEKAGQYASAIEKIKTETQTLKAMYDNSVSNSAIQKKIEELAKLAQTLPDTMLPNKAAH